MANPNFRVVVPKKPEQLIDLAGNINKKHQDDKEQSPLKAMRVHKWEDNGPKIATCLEHHKKAEELKRQMEEEYRNRDLLLIDLVNSVKASRDILLGVCRDNPKIMGEWGFLVDDTPRNPKKVVQ
jgi:hypothetical protein